MIVLDTSVLSLAYRRRERTAAEAATVSKLSELIRGDVELGVPGIVAQELLSGVRSAKEFHRLDGNLTGFRLLLADRATHVEAARMFNECTSHGVPAATADVLVAAHAITVRGRLFTLDDDYKHIAKATKLQLYQH